jgi:hypothetical protein
MERITISPEPTTTYLFQAEVEQEDDGRWSAWIEALLGCATWGATKEELWKRCERRLRRTSGGWWRKGSRFRWQGLCKVVFVALFAL